MRPAVRLPPRAGARLKSAAVPAACVAAYCVLANLFFGYVCPSEILLGLPCPGCGLTRASLLLLSGRLHESLGMNPMLVPGAVCLLFQALSKRAGKFENLSLILICLAASAGFIVFFARFIALAGSPPFTLNRNALMGPFIPDLAEKAILAIREAGGH